jgi:mono/diheme cytochrome c family protein
MPRSLSVAAAALAVSSAVPASAAPPPRGRALYNQACASCHMPDGSGVPGQQPALARSAKVAGPSAGLIRLLLRGAEPSPAGRPAYPNQMPTFESLTDAQIADVLTYVRTSFGNKAGAVTAAQAAAERSRP